MRDAGIVRLIECDTPLVDAVWMKHEQGILISLANYTNKPLSKLSLPIATPKPIARAESAIRGPLEFHVVSPEAVKLSLPLLSNDFVKLYFQ